MCLQELIPCNSFPILLVQNPVPPMKTGAYLGDESTP